MGLLWELYQSAIRKRGQNNKKDTGVDMPLSDEVNLSEAMNGDIQEAGGVRGSLVGSDAEDSPSEE